MHFRDLIKRIKEKWVIIPILALAYLVLIILDASCFIRLISGIYCPFCGMTRATISLLFLNFPLAIQYNPMVFSLPLLLLYFLYDGKPFKNKIINVGIICLLVIGFITVWILRLTGVLPEI